MFWLAPSFRSAALVVLLWLPLPAATFTVAAQDLAQPVKIIVYGDTRFTDPQNTADVSPAARQWLVQKIADEKPAAILMSGDIPLGCNKADYAVFHQETEVWRSGHLRLYPALGNHEFRGKDAASCLKLWWEEFPTLNQMRWYSVQFGDLFYFINLDSNTSLLPGSEQQEWLRKALQAIPNSVKFIFLNLHHPPVSDSEQEDDGHNTRPNEAVITALLKSSPLHAQAAFIVGAGHIHNYERFLQDGTVYLVSGGGGAKPRRVVRTPLDLYPGKEFPNYHFVEFALDGKTLHASMWRLADAKGTAPQWQLKDQFDVTAP